MPIIIDGHDVSEAIRSMQMSLHTSPVACVREVRRNVLRVGSGFVL